MHGLAACIILQNNRGFSRGETNVKSTFKHSLIDNKQYKIPYIMHSKKGNNTIPVAQDPPTPSSW